LKRPTPSSLRLAGIGGSSTPADGYTKAGAAQDIHALVASLGYKNVEIVGHDIGLMVAYAYAAQISHRSL